MDANTKRDDDFKLFRTNVVLIWVFTNLVLVAVLTNSEIQKLMVSQPTMVDPNTGQVVPNPNAMGFSGYLDFLFWVTTFFAWVDEAGIDGRLKFPPDVPLLYPQPRQVYWSHVVLDCTAAV